METNNPMTTKLLPCPFCCGEANLVGLAQREQRIHCRHDLTCLLTDSAIYGFQQKEWNRRAPIAPSLHGRCVEVGPDDDGHRRLIIHTTREAISEFPGNLLHAEVTIIPSVKPYS